MCEFCKCSYSLMLKVYLELVGISISSYYLYNCLDYQYDSGEQMKWSNQYSTLMNLIFELL